VLIFVVIITVNLGFVNFIHSIRGQNNARQFSGQHLPVNIIRSRTLCMLAHMTSQLSCCYILVRDLLDRTPPLIYLPQDFI